MDKGAFTGVITLTAVRKVGADRKSNEGNALPP
jgi:hypothetical protein